MTKQEQKEIEKGRKGLNDIQGMFYDAIRWDKVSEAVKSGALSVDKNGNLKIGN